MSSPYLICPEVDVDIPKDKEGDKKAKLKEEKRKQMSIQADVGILTITPTKGFDDKPSDIGNKTSDSSNSEGKLDLVIFYSKRMP